MTMKNQISTFNFFHVGKFSPSSKIVSCMESVHSHYWPIFIIIIIIIYLFIYFNTQAFCYVKYFDVESYQNVI